MYYKKKYGAEGENIAYNYLKSIGYSIIQKNFSCKFGEIDLIAIDESHNSQEFVFIEVKSRSTIDYGHPSEAVNTHKKRHIIKVAEFFILINHLENANIRFDVIEILYKKNCCYINHIKNAFDSSTVH